jgi:hypothetical protein
MALAFGAGLLGSAFCPNKQALIQKTKGQIKHAHAQRRQLVDRLDLSARVEADHLRYMDVIHALYWIVKQVDSVLHGLDKIQ